MKAGTGFARLVESFVSFHFGLCSKVLFGVSESLTKMTKMAKSRISRISRVRIQGLGRVFTVSHVDRDHVVPVYISLAREKPGNFIFQSRTRRV